MPPRSSRPSKPGRKMCFRACPASWSSTAESASRQPASMFDLVNAVNVVLKRFGQREDRRDIFEDKWTVSEKIEYLMRALSERAQYQVLGAV